MPPRPKPVRNISTSTPATTSNTPTAAKQAGSIIAQNDSPKAMPPPPLPQAILEPELNAMSTCLKNAVVKTGEIYRFYTNAQRLGIQKYSPQPPKSLTSSLGRDLEQYDQLCDTMESHLRNAIAVLQRDLAREEAKAKKAEEEKEAAAAAAAQTSAQTQDVDMSMPPPPNPPTGRETDSPPLGRAPPGRRQSVISMSALQRPAAKHPELKLDLSSSTLRLSAEEAASMFTSGLASPVTLAPKSARPMTADEFSADMMAAMASASSDSGQNPTDSVDLTLSDTGGPVTGSGSSADQPIELDLDGMDTSLAMDLFGDPPESGGAVGDGLFSPAPSMDVQIKSEEQDEAFLQALQMNTSTSDDLFGLGGGDNNNGSQDASTSAMPGPSGGEGSTDGPSPNTLLASFTGQDTNQGGVDDSGNAPLNLDSFSFDMDMGMNVDMSGVDPLLGLEGMGDVDVTNFMDMTSSGNTGEGEQQS